ncbi:GGDEF domain-containing protein [Algicola sagamiensis]|uniref:GGDEF domain-containing protein n=1 Tax=Algicola sagamiensis TaxID=163869 RepID=UPI0003A31D48|nr:diguanylate cyclase [Algicola sagamiensis]
MDQHEIEHEILIHLPFGVAVIDLQGNFQFRNDVFIDSIQLSGTELLGRFQEIRSESFIYDEPQGHRQLTLESRRDGDVYYVFVSQQPAKVAALDKLANFLAAQAVTGEKATLTDIAGVISDATQWPIVGVSRYDQECPHRQATFMVFWSDGNVGSDFSYDLKGTPCEKIATDGQAVVFRNTSKLFPDDAHLQQENIQDYIGIPYRDASGEQVGHIFLANREASDNVDVATDVLNLAASYIGAQLELHENIEHLKQAKDLSRRDVLTGLLNRRAFEQDLSYLRSEMLQSLEVLFGIIDLDGFKGINDRLGHQQGDLLLKRFSFHLSHHFRSNDNVYRIGGDEFAIIMQGCNMRFFKVLQQRVQDSICSVQEEGFKDIDASLGCCGLWEVQGDTEAMIKLADERMYAEKRSFPKRN